MGKRNRDRITLSLVRGVEGLSVYLNGYRIAGPKPWGGGATVAEWSVSRSDDIAPALTNRTEE